MAIIGGSDRIDGAAGTPGGTASPGARRLFGAALVIALAAPQAAPAQPVQPCTISPDPPVFEAAAGGDRLHALPHPRGAGPHTFFHGQVLYGEDTLYLSHLAVFMGLPAAHPHNFQVILEVEIADPEAKAIYQADRAQHPDVIYTVRPPVFDQVALVAEYSGRGLLRSFPQSTVVRGHFEDPGNHEDIIRDTTLEIKRVVHFREFFLGGPRLPDQHYLLFGRGGDIFLSHLLSAPPDFDQFLAAEFEAGDVPTETVGELVEDLLAQGLYLRLADRENTAATRLRAGDVLTCSLETGTRALPITVELRTTAELYCEAGEFVELVMDAFNRPQRCEG